MHTQAIVVSDDNCDVPTLAYILKKTALMVSTSTEKCSFYNHESFLIFIDRQFAAIMAKGFAHIDYNEVLLTGVTVCEAALIFIKAMEHNNVRKLVLHLDESCMRTLTNIKYPRDRVELYLANY